MGNTIDNRVVEMRFDNKQFEDAMATTIKSLDRLSKALELQSATKGFAGVTDAAQKVDLSAISAGVKDINWALLTVTTIAQTVFRNLTTYAMNAGAKIAKALTLEGATSGFREYEQKMGAIQTIMASTKEDLPTVTKYLQELNTYSDQTIYSFADMTQNIGKFTNAGVKLPDAVNAIKGIANAAALAGADAGEAARAMYNFSQALSKGFVALIDWKSIELANMATMEFKNELLAAAVAAGTVKKTSKGLYIAPGMKKAQQATAMFTEELDKQWLTTEVLNTTLKKYQDVTTDIGRRATAAATNIKTFTQMVSVIKESIQSGWAMSWEYIFGDLEEAKKLWTGLALAIGKFLEPMENARNTMLKFWHDNGGREAVIQGFINVFKALKAVLAPFKRIFDALIPDATGEGITKLSKAFESFTEKLIPGAKTIKFLNDAVDFLFAAVDYGKEIFNEFAAAVKTAMITIFVASGFLDAVKEAFNSLVDTVGNLFTTIKEEAKKTKFFENTLDSIKFVLASITTAIQDFVGSFTLFDDISEKVSGGFNRIESSGFRVANVFDAIKTAISKTFEIIKTVLVGAADTISSTMDELMSPGVGKGLAAVVLGGGLIQVGRVINSFIGLVKNGFQIAVSISTAFDELGDVLKTWQNNLRADTLKSIAIAVALLVASLFVVSLINPDRLATSTAAIGVLMLMLVGVMKNFENSKKGMLGLTTGLILFSAAIMVLAVALKILATIDPEAMTRSLIAISLLMAELTAVAKIMGDSDNKNMLGAGLAMMAFAAALAKLAKTVQTLGSMELEQLMQGLLALAALFGFIIGMAKIVDPEEMKALGANLVFIAGAILIMTFALKILGTMALDEIAKGLITMALGLLIMVEAVRLLPRDAPASAASLLIIAGALLVLGLALKLMGTMSWEEIAKSLIVLVISLTVMAVVLRLLATPDVMMGAIALGLVAVSLLVLGKAMEQIGNLSWESIGKGIVVLAAALILLLAAGAVAGIPLVAFGLVVLSASLLLIGAAIFLAGTGMFLFANAVGILGAAWATYGPNLIQGLIALSETLPILARNLAKAFVAFALEMVNQQEQLVKAVVSLFTVILDSLTELIPKMLTFIDEFLTGILDLFIKKIPEINDAMLKILIGIMTTIEENLPIIQEKAANIAVSFINGMAEYYDRILEAGKNFVIKIIEGIGKKSLDIINAAANTIITFINGLTASVKENGKKFADAAKALMDEFAYQLGYFVGRMDFISIGAKIIDGVIAGIKANIKNLSPPIKKAVNAALGFFSHHSEAESPAKKFIPIGKYWVAGLAVGLEKNSSIVSDSAKAVVTSAYKAMADAGSKSIDVFSDIPEPTITPVVNMDNVYQSAKDISSIMDSMPTMAITGQVGARMAGGSASMSTDISNKTEVNFQQNNYSPKALSRLEIYRQTRNQLRQLEGV